MTNWQFEFTRPLWLAALAVLPILLLYWRWSLVRLSPRRQAAALALRSLVIALVVVAMASPSLTRPGSHEMVVAVVDRNASIAPEQYEQVGQYAATASQAGCEMGSFEVATSEDRPRGRTSLAAKIAAARAAIPADRVGRILVFSDGTTGDPAALLRAAETTGMPVSTVPLARVEPEVCVASVHAPERIRLGESLDLEAVILSTGETDATVEVLRDSMVIETLKPRLVPGENRLRTSVKPHSPLPPGEGRGEGTLPKDNPLAVPPHPNPLPEGEGTLYPNPLPHAGEGTSVLTLRVRDCRDTLSENNQAACVVSIGPRPRVLLVESRPVLAEHLAKALRSENVEVEVRPQQDLPAAVDELNRYELVILSNVPARDMPLQRMEALRSYVRDHGGGLIAVGGDQAFTAGGYRGTVLEEILPVISEVKSDKPRPSLALVLVLDCSHSMQGQKIELARQATRGAVAMLGPRDQVGVIAFEDRSRWVAPLAPAADKAKILAQIATIQAAGRTVMYPPIEQAYLALRESFADLKHIIVMSDGISDPGDFDGLCRRIAAEGITLSTVGLGNEPARPLLAGMADRAKGRAYFCDDAAAVPKIFQIETASAGQIGITERAFRPKVTHSLRAIRGLERAEMPTLLGYVDTQPKPTARVILESGPGEPLLALWHCGRGTTAAFTSDIQSRWAAAWLGWPGFGRFWVELVRQTMRREGPPNVRLQARAADGRILATLDARGPDRRFINAIPARIAVVDPAGKKTEAAMLQVAPGRYETLIDAATPGVYQFDARLTDGARTLAEARHGIVTGYPEELKIRLVNEPLLRAIAQKTGGQFNPTPAEAFAPLGKTVPVNVRLWPWAVALAVALLVGEIAMRRIIRDPVR